MFFSTYVLTKKGPLAKIWLAAHWDKKLTRSEIRAIDLNQTIVHIIQPVVPIALRTSGELLIGVVRVYALKVKQLLKDATDATILLRTANVQLVAKAAAKGVDGVPLPGAKDAMAVTMDLVLSKGGAAPEDLCEADFDGIADLLKGGKGPAGGFGSHAIRADDEVVGSAWFTIEPSQYLEEQMPLDGANALEDGIARIRADLLALGEESVSSKSKSSTSSAEKARKSGGAAVLGYDNLDIGQPLPMDELGVISAVGDINFGMDMDMGGMFDVPDVIGAPEDAAVKTTEESAAVSMQQRFPKKIKVVNVLDAATTVLSKAEIDKWTRDRSDIVEQERRFGPIDSDDERNRTTLRTAETTVITLEPVSFIPNPALRAVFASALTSSVTRVHQEIEKTRASNKAPTRQSLAGGDVFVGDDVALGAAPDLQGPEFDFGGAIDFPVDALAQEEAAPKEKSSKTGKRGRDADESTPFSASTIATLGALKEVLRSAPSTTFGKFSKGMRRVDAARTFVDVLALASHSVIEVRQSEPFADIALVRTAVTASS